MAWLRNNFLFLFMVLLFGCALKGVDRFFFSQNAHFCIWQLYCSSSRISEWEAPRLTADEEKQIYEILGQKFSYLAKGAHCAAFISEDNKYVIKFLRFPSQFRPFSWFRYVFSFHFSDERKSIRQYNLNHLNYHLENYIHCFEELKEESGLIFLHINHTDHLHRDIVLTDQLGAEYRVPLDRMTFMVQHKADLIYPTLDRLVFEKKIDQAKDAVSQLIHLFVVCAQKGYVDNDPILRNNYGFFGDRAIHIDIGDMVKNEEVKKRENYIPYIRETTASMKHRLVEQYPELLDHYERELDRLSFGQCLLKY